MYQFQPISSREVWENFLLRYAPQSLFQSWLWGEVQEKMGLSLWRMGVYDGKNLVGIAQIGKVKARRGWFLHIRHGPIFIEQNTSYWKEFLVSMRLLAKNEHAWFIRVSPLIENSKQHNGLLLSLGFRPAPIHAMDAELCWVLDIDKSDDELLAGMRKTTRYEIRRAEKLGVTVSRSMDAKDLKNFLALYGETSKRHHFVPHKGIEEEYEIFAKESKALLLLGVYEGKVLAGALILFYGGQAFYHHGASLSTKVPASSFLQWEAIREAKKRGIKLYNFWGIAPEDKPNHPWRGTTLFKKGFGGREVQYIHAHDLAISPFYIVPKTIESIRRKMKGY
ncbi:hypothetical protein A2Z00_02155 [Candidatus Gottesmanbacteria bacterium RBG_13_45_10]|uniref:BioF2-like acetyltransferase domain-containing protein n=1 Tax=Candidatus Gottesmanbacteria bacterium RBG_13_45_10 TaxID=1798370 RepID=A0A1F5ZFK1_9BACT|nr:MAG: hypothetical protein A2Z00_02155 [Candidatus Gottesmanbacteria bacterium RBG_13_45_10]